jgi:hypothetical protein
MCGLGVDLVVTRLRHFPVRCEASDTVNEHSSVAVVNDEQECCKTTSGLLSDPLSLKSSKVRIRDLSMQDQCVSAVSIENVDDFTLWVN